jgi:hypothetical protein
MSRYRLARVDGDTWPHRIVEVHVGREVFRFQEFDGEAAWETLLRLNEGGDADENPEHGLNRVSP